ncbi:MAG TPA: DUF3830 family protein [Capillimicrobium sp.]|nr:DUF3830 family protein [Capillimicrobium sp.]
MRHLRITLGKRGVSCVARLLDAEAPQTCDAVWNALPQSGDAWHGTYCSNEVYALLPPFDARPGMEHPTIVPAFGDVVYWDVPIAHLPSRIRDDPFRGPLGFESADRFVDIAIFYGRNNYLYNPASGPMPGNVFATIVDGLDEMSDACRDVWRQGSVGERLVFERHED